MRVAHQYVFEETLQDIEIMELPLLLEAAHVGIGSHSTCCVWLTVHLSLLISYVRRQHINHEYYRPFNVVHTGYRQI